MAMRYDDDEDDQADDPDDVGTIPCPYCGEAMLEMADYCPSCDRWITEEEKPGRKRLPSWGAIIIVLLLVAFLFAALRPF
jgi:hypothetical protein